MADNGETTAANDESPPTPGSGDASVAPTSHLETHAVSKAMPLERTESEESVCEPMVSQPAGIAFSETMDVAHDTTKMNTHSSDSEIPADVSQVKESINFEKDDAVPRQPLIDSTDITTHKEPLAAHLEATEDKPVSTIGVSEPTLEPAKQAISESTIQQEASEITEPESTALVSEDIEMAIDQTPTDDSTSKHDDQTENSLLEDEPPEAIATEITPIAPQPAQLTLTAELQSSVAQSSVSAFVEGTPDVLSPSKATPAELPLIEAVTPELRPSEAITAGFSQNEAPLTELPLSETALGELHPSDAISVERTSSVAIHPTESLLVDLPPSEAMTVKSELLDEITESDDVEMTEPLLPSVPKTEILDTVSEVEPTNSNQDEPVADDVPLEQMVTDDMNSSASVLEAVAPEADKGEVADELSRRKEVQGYEMDEERTVTMLDVLQEQEELEDSAGAVLGASDDNNCTYAEGYIKRQALYACMTCCSDAKMDPTKRAGVCLACSLTCHENHELIELYTKRKFRCDCGNPNFNSHGCTFTKDKTEFNVDNKYNQNFSGLYCICHRPYPDPESSIDDEMIQCIICEDWLHASHLDSTVPANDQYSEMICKSCMDKNEFLHDYTCYAVAMEQKDRDVKSLDKESPNESTAAEPRVLSDSLREEPSRDDSHRENMQDANDVTSENGMMTSSVNEKNDALHDKGLKESTIEESKAPESKVIQDDSELSHVAHRESIQDAKDVTSDSGMLTLSVNEKNDAPHDEGLKESTIDESKTAEPRVLSDSLRAEPSQDDSELSHVAHPESIQDAKVVTSENGTLTSSVEEKNDAPHDKGLKESTIEESKAAETRVLSDSLRAEPSQDDSEPSHAPNRENMQDAKDVTNENGTLTSSVKEKNDALLVEGLKDPTDKETNEIVNETNTEIEVEHYETKEKLYKKNTELIVGSGPDMMEGLNVPADQEIKINDGLEKEGSEPQNPKPLDEKEINTSEQATVDESNNLNLSPEINQKETSIDELPEKRTSMEKTIDTTENGHILDDAPKQKLLENNEVSTEVAQDQKCINEIDESVHLEKSSPQEDKIIEDNENDECRKEKTSTISEENYVEKTKECSPDIEGTTNDEKISDVQTTAEIISKKEQDCAPVIDKQKGSSLDEFSNVKNVMGDCMEPCNTTSTDVEMSDESEKSSLLNQAKSKMDAEADTHAATDITFGVNLNKETDRVIADVEMKDDAAQENANENLLDETGTSSNITNMETTAACDTNEVVDKVSNEAMLNGDVQQSEESDLETTNKRKLSAEISEDVDKVSVKKAKLGNEVELCQRPKQTAKKVFKGATFWPCSWRQKLCSCHNCVSMYRDNSVLFLLDLEDTVSAYEELGKVKNGGKLSQYEKGLAALSSLDRIQQINALTEYNKMKDELLDFLISFKNRQEVVKVEDIEKFFADIKPKRKSDGVYFCR